jgi:DNA repair exonuclease SbcCD ATPase subunit
MSEKSFCPYCGNPIRPRDKYCIICGKPLLSDLPGKANKEAENKVKDDIEDAKKKEKPFTLRKGKREKEEEVEEEVEKEEAAEEEKIEEEKEEEEEEVKEEKKELKPLPEEIKYQVELYAEYSDLQFEKEKLLEKLDEVSDMMKDDRYETDFDYKQNVNIKLKAVKTLINELKEKEKDLKAKMGDTFIIQDLTTKIEAKKYQLKNLTREYRLKKVDKQIFNKLKDRYKATKQKLEAEVEELRGGLTLWLQDLIAEKNDLIGEIRLNKGRRRAEEIEEEEYKEVDDELQYKLKKVEAKIDTVEKLIEG